MNSARRPIAVSFLSGLYTAVAVSGCCFATVGPKEYSRLEPPTELRSQRK
jgi:hypothetical protein